MVALGGMFLLAIFGDLRALTSSSETVASVSGAVTAASAALDNSMRRAESYNVWTPAPIADIPPADAQPAEILPAEAQLSMEDSRSSALPPNLEGHAEEPVPSSKFGFYLHVFADPAAVIHQVRQVKQNFPDSPVYVMSDGGLDFSNMCKREKCIFTLCPPANDRWHPWPFFRRLYDAALSLNTEFIIMLEPDNTLHGPVKRLPQDDAGGVHVPKRSFRFAEHVEKLAQNRAPGFQWSAESMQAGLCGGAYFRTEAVLDAFSDENMMRIDWNLLGESVDKEIFSSDFAMQYALAARGWRVGIWEEVAQMDKDKEVPLTGSRDAAFRHYCSCYPGGKPTYNLKLRPEDEDLFAPAPAEYTVPNSNCQLCYNLDRYVENWGSPKCTNRLPFSYSQKLMDTYHPELKSKPCELPFLCKPQQALPNSVHDSKYGFYLHVYADPAAVIFQVRQLRKHFPTSPIYVMSDGGMDFSPLCEQQGCTFKLCPPANDRWHPWPFFRRLYDAAESLNTEYVIMLEPDNTIHGPIKREPKHDAGGIYVQDRSFGLVDYVEKLAKARVPGFKWSRKAMSAGLAGGAYFRREAILDALSDENMMKLDWNMLGEQATKEIYSSDFAMQYAFAARGWQIEPWEETAQMDKNKDIPLTGPKDASFRHYCSCYPGGKPTYNIKLKKEDEKLVRQQPEKYQQTNSVCQLCYNRSRYVALWGTTDCTNKLPFQYSNLLMERYHPEVLKGKCELPWLCERPKR